MVLWGFLSIFFFSVHINIEYVCIVLKMYCDSERLPILKHGPCEFLFKVSVSSK